MCRRCRIVESARATFYLCERSFVDPRFRKYPPLPVIRCAGYEASRARSPTSRANRVFDWFAGDSL